jgi:hypothetical protein
MKLYFKGIPVHSKLCNVPLLTLFITIDKHKKAKSVLNGGIMEALNLDSVKVLLI